MKLYSGPLSLFTAKVRIALDEKALPYQRIDVGWSRADRYLPHHPEVSRLNPKAEVPVLVDGDVVVYDSSQIFEYLDDAYPEPPLYPKDAAERARCRRLEAWADEIFFPNVWDLIEEAFYPAADDRRDPARLSGAHQRIAELHRQLDGELGKRQHLCGDFSVADIAAFVFVSSAATLGAPPAEGLVALTGWLARVGARPAVGKEVAGLTEAAAKAMAG